MKKMLLLIVVLPIVVLASSACQNNKRNRVDYAEYISKNGLVKQNRVQHFRFQGWQPLSDRYLILRSNQRKSYLVRLMSACIDLPYAQNIQINQDSTRILNAKFDSITVLGQMSQKCRIDTIYELDKIQKQALLDFSNQSEEIRG